MKVFITRQIPDRGINILKEMGYAVVIGPQDRVLKKEELIEYLKKDKYNAVLALLTDKIDAEILDAMKDSGVKILANYAVGFDNIDIKAATERGIMVTNTPGVLTETVAEHTFSLMLSIAHRIPESDRFTRAGKYHGWEPMMFLGTDVSKKTLGVVGLGRIGSKVAYHAAKGFEMKVLYYDPKRSEDFEKEFGVDSTGSPQTTYRKNVDDIFREADFVSIHVPLLPTTRHLVDARRLALMKKTAYLINTSRGPIVDEAALVEALRNNIIRGAALDVYENEPSLSPGLADCENAILTPHTASATEETRQAMGELAAKNIIETLEGRIPPNLVKI
ncbi:MAG: D-isomer specific 2-hydroxyacid dehydrogenase NAD-binding protein [Parcubacteria group bacterium GW2011_GWA2_45_30]|nr:MAG: D-isomer specific 2-hydroxyacid dehydrogenase NAD-binding protein [Parcubacteria group bacterium GW2011_GWA2_45_30]